MYSLYIVVLSKIPETWHQFFYLWHLSYHIYFLKWKGRQKEQVATTDYKENKEALARTSEVSGDYDTSLWQLRVKKKKKHASTGSVPLWLFFPSASFALRLNHLPPPPLRLFNPVTQMIENGIRNVTKPQANFLLLLYFVVGLLFIASFCCSWK